MKNGTVLIAIGKDTALGDLTKKLDAIRSTASRAVVLVIGKVPAFPFYAVGVPPYGAMDFPAEWHDEVTARKTALHAKADAVEKLLQQHNVSGEVTAIACEPYAVDEAIARRAMLCDIAMIDDDLRSHDAFFGQMVNGVLFQSPVGLLLNDRTGQVLTGPKRIFVAWNVQLHSARAVHKALGMLRRADEVTIGIVDPIKAEYKDGEDPGVDIAKWLTQHGCNVTVQQYPSGGLGIGECILDRAQELGADLIVMGAYSRSKAREAIFGSTTKTLIDQTDRAVFLAH